MIRYTIEEDENKFNMFLIDDEYNLKILVGVIYDKAHSRIILRKMNEYVSDNRINQLVDNKTE